MANQLIIFFFSKSSRNAIVWLQYLRFYEFKLHDLTLFKKTRMDCVINMWEYWRSLFFKHVFIKFCKNIFALKA